MTAAIRRGLTWLLCVLAIIAGSLAWTGWVYLNTWADPETTTRVIDAVLDDPGARDEVLAPVRGQVMSAIPAEFGVTQDQVDAALVAVLADSSARDRIADSFVTDDGDLRFSEASRAFQTELARSQPQLAPIIEETPTSLSLPDVSTSSSLRDLADTWVWRLALISAGLFLVSFVLGDARLTARRFGYWAVATGILWVVGAPIAAWLAPRVSSGIDSTATVVVREYTAPIGPRALALTIAGLVAVAASFLVPRRREAPARAAAPARAPEPRQPRRRTATPGSRAGAPAAAPVPATEQVPTVRRVDETRTMPVQTARGTDESPPESPREPPSEPADVDVWAAYDAPAPRNDA